MFMDLIKRILLIFILVFTIFSSFEANATGQFSNSYCATISAIKPLEKNYINSKNNQLNLSVIQNSSCQLTSRRNNDNQTCNANDNIVAQLKQFNNLISYIYTREYLDDKNELALLLLLHQIQPNAP